MAHAMGGHGYRQESSCRKGPARPGPGPCLGLQAVMGRLERCGSRARGAPEACACRKPAPASVLLLLLSSWGPVPGPGPSPVQGQKK